VSALDERGHLFVRFAGDGLDYCVGCGHTAGSVEATARCSDAEGLAADMEAQEYLDRLRLAAVK
jgi:hypothetical protein